MNKYNVSFSMFPIVNNKITSKGHFSNCKTSIQGNTFDEAVENFKKQKLEEGWAIGFLVEGDISKVEFFDI
ncbi:hypothetical protein AF332_11730 [Sporosarcina globispora]|uniref:Uncharacterized protein n=1 Tax=Sporosarcina globispora TaxID=1459 RepID=A0A0M0GBY5_SPOGL|nr:hypothetical protein [Sporosarcina globispora]KON87430.1 hypothetical protein AF332_11730 [Sporosarcina globispora]